MSQPPPDEPRPLENVTQIFDVDVLCGRGGAALRHPGNQTYRRLVNLNKGLYITCLKTEKLKISRSIVAAIREQKGRFLEKDAKSNTWYDIGDKKAVEKTSQALREGQPKLRQKIVELGGGAMGAASLMERQYGAQAGVYPEQVGLNTASDMDSILPPVTATQHEVAALAVAQLQRQQSLQGSHAAQQQHQHHQPLHSMLGGGGSSNGGMHPHSDILVPEAELLQRLSLRDLNHDGGGGDTDEFPYPQRVQPRELRPSINLHGSKVGVQLGFTADSQMSLLSEFSAFQNESLLNMGGCGDGNGSFRAPGRGINNAARGGAMPPPNLSLQSITSNDQLLYGNLASGRGGIGNSSQSGYGGGGGGRSQEARQAMPSQNPLGRGAEMSMPAPATSNPMVAGRDVETTLQYYPSSIMPGGAGGGKSSLYYQQGSDRRQVFAKMKYTRPPSVGTAGKMGGSSHHSMAASNHSFGDGMPEIHMVESQLSLISNMTDHKSSHMTDSRHMTDSKHAQYTTTPSSSSSAAFASSAPERKPVKGSDEKMEVSSTHSYGMDIGSKHSIMSGLSRISDASIDTSIFSDLSKKIGDVSTRSIAMSEMGDTLHTMGTMGDTAHERVILEGADIDAMERVNAADFDA